MVGDSVGDGTEESGCKAKEEGEDDEDDDDDERGKGDADNDRACRCLSAQVSACPKSFVSDQLSMLGVWLLSLDQTLSTD